MTVIKEAEQPKNKKFLKCIPIYAIIPTLLMYGGHFLVYELTLWINTFSSLPKYDLTTALDKLVPFRAEWILVYISCYLVWLIGFFVVANLGKKYFYRFATAYVLGILAGGLIFLVFPTTINIPAVTGNSFFDNLVKGIYAADQPYNLFPSFHCFNTWIIFIGMREKKDLSWWYKSAFLIFSILVFLATQFVKQHYFVDIIGGVALAEIVWWSIRFTKLPTYTEKMFTQLNYVLHLEKRPAKTEKPVKVKK